MATDNRTRLKVASAATPYVRVAAGDSGGTMPDNADWAVHDVAHSDPLTTGLGSSIDFELHSDAATTWSAAPSIALTDTTVTALPNTQNSLLILHIKHSGYKEATKENATADSTTLRIFMGAASSGTSEYFSLYPNESITLHGPFGANVVNSNLWYVQASAAGGLYVEVVACTSGPVES